MIDRCIIVILQALEYKMIVLQLMCVCRTLDAWYSIES